MIQEWLVPVASGVLIVLAAAAVWLLRREFSRARADVAATRAEARELRERIEELAGQVEPAHREPDQFVITQIGEVAAPPAEPQRIEGRLFADIVLRESVVKAAALTYGVRRALAPETRNRIRFEMRREVKRSRKQRRATMRSIRREMHTRERHVEEAS